MIELSTPVAGSPAQNAATPPRMYYLLGNDQLGSDILSRLIYGTRIAMMVAFTGTGGALLLVLVAGHGPRQLDTC